MFFEAVNWWRYFGLNWHCRCCHGVLCWHCCSCCHGVLCCHGVSVLGSNHREALLDKESEISSLLERLRMREGEIQRMREDEAQRASALQNAILTYVQGSSLGHFNPKKWHGHHCWAVHRKPRWRCHHGGPIVAAGGATDTNTHTHTHKHIHSNTQTHTCICTHNHSLRHTPRYTSCLPMCRDPHSVSSTRGTDTHSHIYTHSHTYADTYSSIILTSVQGLSLFPRDKGYTQPTWFSNSLDRENKTFVSSSTLRHWNVLQCTSNKPALILEYVQSLFSHNATNINRLAMVYHHLQTVDVFYYGRCSRNLCQTVEHYLTNLRHVF